MMVNLMVEFMIHFGKKEQKEQKLLITLCTDLFIELKETKLKLPHDCKYTACWYSSDFFIETRIFELESSNADSPSLNRSNMLRNDYSFSFEIFFRIFHNVFRSLIFWGCRTQLNKVTKPWIAVETWFLYQDFPWYFSHPNLVYSWQRI